MITADNELWVGGQRLDFDEGTQLLPSFQANDRTKPDTIQSDYSPEFEVPGTSNNHRILGQAVASQVATGTAYTRLPAVLTSGGVETLPLALLYVKGYAEGRYQLQIAGGNRRFVEAIGDKTLADLDFSRFDHSWLPSTVATALTYTWWQASGWGYEIYDRGRPVDLQNLDPYTLYPSVAAWLIWSQILADAGFTADSLLAEPLFTALNVPSANPYTYSSKFREVRALNAGLLVDSSLATNPLEHSSEFAPEKLSFEFVGLPPYHAPTEGATYLMASYKADTLGYYRLSASVLLNYGCDDRRPGKVSCKVMLYVNGQPVYYGNDQLGQDEHPRVGSYVEETFTPSLPHHLLHPNDTVELYWQGDDWATNGFGPYDQRWRVAYGNRADVGIPGKQLYTKATLTVELLEEFPQGGLVRLQQWLPDLKQIEFVKTIMAILGLTIQTDDYLPHLYLSPGSKMLGNASRARDWTAKRDAFSRPGQVPERNLGFRFGDYGQKNTLAWSEDEDVTLGYGDGTILIADEVLPAQAELVRLPFAATEESTAVANMLRIRNFKVDDITVNPVTYSAVQAKPRLTLRRPDVAFTVQLITTARVGNPGDSNYVAQVLLPVTTTVSYFAGVTLSLLLNGTVLTTYWADLRAMLDHTRYLSERYRLSAQDIAELDYSIPIWDGYFGDYFAVSQVSEFDARRSTEVKLVRLNAAHLPPPVIPALGREFYLGEFYNLEHY